MRKLALVSIAIALVGSALANGKPVSVAGTWLLNGNDKSTKWVFKPDGTFSFISVAANASSKGRWSVEGSKIKLVWSEIDKQKVAAGKVKGAFPLGSDGTFRVNHFVYRKQKVA